MATRNDIINDKGEYLWNPWLGCHRVSTGCDYCIMIANSYKKGNRECEHVKFNKKDFYLPTRKTRVFNTSLDKNIMTYKIPSGNTIIVCDNSDFLISDADYYRKRAWKIIRERRDLLFKITTKRIERFNEVLPDNWFTGWHNVSLGVSVENQRTADIRIPELLSARVIHRYIEIAPILDSVDIKKYLSSGLIESVIVKGETGSNSNIRICDYRNVLSIAKQCELYDIDFKFESTGSKLLKDDTIIKINSRDEKNLANFYNIDINNERFNWEATQTELDNLDRIEQASEIFKLLHSDKN